MAPYSLEDALMAEVPPEHARDFTADGEIEGETTCALNQQSNSQWSRIPPPSLNSVAHALAIAEGGNLPKHANSHSTPEYEDSVNLNNSNAMEITNMQQKNSKSRDNASDGIRSIDATYLDKQRDA